MGGGSIETIKTEGSRKWERGGIDLWGSLNLFRGGRHRHLNLLSSTLSFSSGSPLLQEIKAPSKDWTLAVDRDGKIIIGVVRCF